MEKVKKYGKIALVAIAILAIFAFAIIVAILYGWIGILGPYYNVPNDNKAVADYDQSMGLVSDKTYEALQDMDSSKVELGVNEEGKVVFKHPYKAFGKCKKAYKHVWKYADKELELKHLSRTFYVDYTADDTIDAIVAANPDVATDASIYREILLIYSNSYNKHR